MKDTESANTLELPLGLRHALESGECVLFIGAGSGKHLLDAKGAPAPDGKTLAKDLARQFSIEAAGIDDLAKISQVVQIRKGRAELEAYLSKRFSNLTPDKVLRWISTLRWKAIYTTNYDDGIQQTYALNPKPIQQPVTMASTSDLASFDRQYDVPIYHLHGALFGSTAPQLVITEDDYGKFKERRKMLFELLKKDFATSCILYIGYANEDHNWKMVQAEMAEEFFPSKLPRSYRISPSTNPLELEILRSKMIDTISCSYEEFVQLCSTTLAESVIDSDRISKARSTMPTDLIPFLDKYAVPMMRLISSWTYVNQAPFDQTPNIASFLKGDKPNWALVGARLHFERDIEEPLYNELIEYATGTEGTTKVAVALGSAGYGTSTLLMSVAARVVNERAGKVFMLKPGRPLLEGDVEFALSLFKERVFFFIDNGSDYASALKTIIQKMKESHRTVMFVLGERINEWRQCPDRIAGREFQIEPLSDPEINRLLDCLSKNSGLGKLEPLDRDMQFAVIKSKYGKELLVTMREATEDRRFDAIMEDEFRGISDPVARRAYLLVSCFYQHGSYIREDLLAELLEVPIAEFNAKVGSFTEGIIAYECIDEYNQRYVARARHRVIAQVVWERCSNDYDKDAMIRSSLSALNLNYGSDKDAFENFIRSDRLIDSIGTLDSKIKFFDTACQKDPNSPYVKQHYARMLSREGKWELALSQIDDAIRINSKARVLYHTRAVILMQLALNTDSQDMARRRLAQSEESFKRCLRMDNKDEYGYQGLAQLYFEWAKHVPDQQESTEYLSKAEAIITEGLKNSRVRDGLWIESSKIEKWIGNEPAHIAALKKAVEDSPGSIIARYLLGRSYRRDNKPNLTIEVLEPIIKNHHDEFRVFVEYTMAMVYCGESYSKAIAILLLSSLYGLSDSRYIATLGGMYTMNGNLTDAEEIFKEADKRHFTASESNTIQFKPPDPSDFQTPLRIEGTVRTVKAGYSMINVEGYPMFLCPGSKFGGIIMKAGLKITFEPSFSARGRIADHPQVI